jgi:hypothetical protein
MFAVGARSCSSSSGVTAMEIDVAPAFLLPTALLSVASSVPRSPSKMASLRAAIVVTLLIFPIVYHRSPAPGGMRASAAHKAWRRPRGPTDLPPVSRYERARRST